METEESIFLMFAGGIIITSIVLPVLIGIKRDIINTYLRAYPFVYDFFNNVILNNITIIIFFTLLAELLIYLIYKKISESIKTKQRIRDEIENGTAKESSQLNYFLNVDIKSLKYKQLLKLYNKFQYPNFHYLSLLGFEEDIELKLFEAKKRLIVLDHKEDINNIEIEKQEAEQELERINHEIYLKELRDKEKIEKIRERLGINVKEVFRAKNLGPKEKEIAKQEGYKSINEYCVLENKFIPVLIKPPLNHSPTHAFLVWSVKRLLKKFPRIERIIEHETRDADLTFRIKTKTYAIEIEKGSLLRKKGQLREKIEFLDDVYRDRWLILVSNKTLAKKYREFGSVATRKDLRKKIEKWVKEAETRKKSAKK